jgi:hypothetical protein
MLRLQEIICVPLAWAIRELLVSEQ